MRTVMTSASATAIVIPVDTTTMLKEKSSRCCPPRKASTSSVSTFTLMTRAKKKTATKANPNALATESSTSLLKGDATAVSSMQMREKRKAISSCRTEPGQTRTQKPTRKSLPRAAGLQG